jgi:hypothetical protein
LKSKVTFFAKLQTFAIRVYQRFLAAIEKNIGSNPINNFDLEPDLFAEKNIRIERQAVRETLHNSPSCVLDVSPN